MPISTDEPDIILNRINVALAQSQRLVASWLPPLTEEEDLRKVKSEEQLEQEEFATFTPTPELLGLGATLLKGSRDDVLKRPELNSNDRLRKQLLGRELTKLTGKPSGSIMGGSQVMHMGSKPRLSSVKGTMVGERNEEEEESGRSSLGKSKRNQMANGAMFNDSAIKETATKYIGDASAKDSPASFKGHKNYLDEVLEKRMSKKKKKKRKRNKQAVTGTA